MRKLARQALTGAQSHVITVDFPTSDPAEKPLEATVSRYWCLTIVYHPDPARIGAQFRWPTRPGIEVAISRLKPEFVSADGSPSRPLEATCVSRSPLWLKNTEQGVLLHASDWRSTYTINGRPGDSDESIPARFIRRGTLLGLGSAVCFLLHPSNGESRPGHYPELIGVSDETEQVRQQLDRLCRVDLPILLTGESGSGKELIARAIHHAGVRAGRPLLTVNIAAFTPTTAAAELFGHARGVFTGATEARPGLLRQAEGGTVLLDEIGDASPEMQALLLRVLESGEIQPLGLPPVKTDVHIIAATDANLESLVRTGTFRQSLLHRLSVTTLHIPPLRERLVDVPLLFVSFLRQALTRLNAQHRLEPGDGPWLHRRDILALLSYSWPGNVRELRNVAQHTAVHSHHLPHATLPAWLLNRLMEFAPSDGTAHTQDSDLPLHPRAVSGPLGMDISSTALNTPSGLRTDPYGSPSFPPNRMTPPQARPSQLSEDALTKALEANGWNIQSTADALEISKKSLYALMSRFGIRTAGSLSEEEIRRAIREENTLNVSQLAARLKVSKRGLTIRMRSTEWPAGSVKVSGVLTPDLETSFEPGPPPSAGYGQESPTGATGSSQEWERATR